MPFLISFLAGCSTLIGYLFIFLNRRKNHVLIGGLSFASGVMFYISLFDLIPESIKLISINYHIMFSILIVLLFMSIGILLSFYLNRIIPSNDSYLYKVGIISMIAIIIHNIPEGIATYLTSSYNLRLGFILAISIALHNIPEGISISVPIYYSTGSKTKAFIYTFISGFSEFFGSIIASIFIRDVSFLFMGSLYSIIAGIMIYISIVELLPTSIKYNNLFLTSIMFIIGILFIRFSIILIK